MPPTETAGSASTHLNKSPLAAEIDEIKGFSAEVVVIVVVGEARRSDDDDAAAEVAIRRRS